VSKKLEGKLVRFEKNGVGVVDVDDIDQYIYFTPKDIAGYTGQTVQELKSGPDGQWTEGKTVIIQGDIHPTGNVQVKSVTLKR
jgi:hypothetical protein